jgi:hypothetical protein
MTHLWLQSRPRSYTLLHKVLTSLRKLVQACASLHKSFIQNESSQACTSLRIKVAQACILRLRRLAARFQFRACGKLNLQACCKVKIKLAILVWADPDQTARMCWLIWIYTIGPSNKGVYGVMSYIFKRHY